MIINKAEPSYEATPFLISCACGKIWNFIFFGEYIVNIGIKIGVFEATESIPGLFQPLNVSFFTRGAGHTLFNFPYWWENFQLSCLGDYSFYWCQNRVFESIESIPELRFTPECKFFFTYGTTPFLTWIFCACGKIFKCHVSRLLNRFLGSVLLLNVIFWLIAHPY